MNLLPLAHIVAKFILDGKIYEVESFKIGFEQPVDYKGQPQHENKRRTNVCRTAAGCK